SDEDLFNMAHKRIVQANLSNQPYFSLVFTSSNHSPYEFPDGKIDLHSAEKQTDLNAVKYADYALGQFFNTAMK
ncbi:sulfatase-like hydrolase/transferase, partial [Methylophaga sp. UBA3595]